MRENTPSNQLCAILVVTAFFLSSLATSHLLVKPQLEPVSHYSTHSLLTGFHTQPLHGLVHWNAPLQPALKPLETCCKTILSSIITRLHTFIFWVQNLRLQKTQIEKSILYNYTSELFTQILHGAHLHTETSQALTFYDSITHPSVWYLSAFTFLR